VDGKKFIFHQSTILPSHLAVGSGDHDHGVVAGDVPLASFKRGYRFEIVTLNGRESGIVPRTAGIMDPEKGSRYTKTNDNADRYKQECFT